MSFIPENFITNKTPISVKDFGAKGDGTTNDQAAIQAAHDSLPSTGGSLFFPDGTYAINSSLVFTKPIYMEMGVASITALSSYGDALIKVSANLIVQGISQKQSQFFPPLGHPAFILVAPWFQPSDGGTGDGNPVFHLSRIGCVGGSNLLDASATAIIAEANFVVEDCRAVSTTGYAIILGSSVYYGRFSRNHWNFVYGGVRVLDDTETKIENEVIALNRPVLYANAGTMGASSIILTLAGLSSINIGDVVRVVGAGATGRDLVATILNVSGSTITLDIESSTMVISANVFVCGMGYLLEQAAHVDIHDCEIYGYQTVAPDIRISTINNVGDGIVTITGTKCGTERDEWMRARTKIEIYTPSLPNSGPLNVRLLNNRIYAPAFFAITSIGRDGSNVATATVNCPLSAYGHGLQVGDKFILKFVSDKTFNGGPFTVTAIGVSGEATQTVSWTSVGSSVSQTNLGGFIASSEWSAFGLRSPFASLQIENNDIENFTYGVDDTGIVVEGVNGVHGRGIYRNNSGAGPLAATFQDFKSGWGRGFQVIENDVQAIPQFITSTQRQLETTKVQNRVLYSENSAQWFILGGVSFTTGQTDPLGNTNATKVTRTGSAAIITLAPITFGEVVAVIIDNTSLPTTGGFLSFWAKAGSLSSLWIAMVDNNGILSGAGRIVSLDSTWRKYRIPYIINAGGGTLALRFCPGGPGILNLEVGDIYLYGLQVSDVECDYVTTNGTAVNNLDAGIVLNKELVTSTHVKRFGAVGDGVVDDTIAIQSAINNVVANGGGTVFLSDGNYKVSSLINITGAVTFDGQNSGSLWLDVSPAFSADASDVNWKDLTIKAIDTPPIAVNDGHITSGTNILTSASAPFSAAQGKMQLTIKGAGVAGADLVTLITSHTSTTQVTLRDNASTTVTTANILIGPVAHLLKFKVMGSDTIYHNTGWYFDHVIFDGVLCSYLALPREDSLDTFMAPGTTTTDVEEFVELECEHKNVTHFGTSSSYGIFTAGITDGWFVRCWIHDIGTDDGFTGDDGFILVSGPTTKGGVHLIECTIENNARNGVSNYDAGRTDIIDCTIRSNGVAGIDDSWNDQFVSLIPSARSHFIGNRIYDHIAGPSSFAMKLSNKAIAERNELENNYLGIFTVPSQGPALLPSDGVRIVNNTIKDGYYGIIDNSNNAYIAGNFCEGQSVFGFSEALPQVIAILSTGDGYISSGSFDLTSVSAPFLSTSIGGAILITGAGVGSADLITTIATFISTSHITVTTAASTSVTTADIKSYSTGTVRARWHGNTGTLQLTGTDSQVRDHDGTVLFSGSETRTTVNGVGTQTVSAGSPPTNDSTTTPPSSWRIGDIIIAGGAHWRYDGTTFHPIPRTESSITHLQSVNGFSFDSTASNGQSDFLYNGTSFLTLKRDAFNDVFITPPASLGGAFFIGAGGTAISLFCTTATLTSSSTARIWGDANSVTTLSAVLDGAGASALNVGAGVTSFDLSQSDKVTNSGTGANFIIHAQNETGTTSIGGSLVLQSGTGTSTNGVVAIKGGSTLKIQADDTGVNIPNLTANQTVVTDGSKYLTSLAYTTSDTASTLVERDSSSRISTKGLISSGTTPTIFGTPTGIGDTGTVTLDTGSNDLSGQLIINPGGSGILTYAIIVMQFSTALPGNNYTAMLQLIDSAGAWGGGTITGLSTVVYAWVSQSFIQIFARSMNGDGAGGLTQGVTLPSGSDQLRIGYHIILK